MTGLEHCETSSQLLLIFASFVSTLSLISQPALTACRQPHVPTVQVNFLTSSQHLAVLKLCHELGGVHPAFSKVTTQFILSTMFSPYSDIWWTFRISEETNNGSLTHRWSFFLSYSSFKECLKKCFCWQTLKINSNYTMKIWYINKHMQIFKL